MPMAKIQNSERHSMPCLCPGSETFQHQILNYKTVAVENRVIKRIIMTIVRRIELITKQFTSGCCSLTIGCVASVGLRHLCTIAVFYVSLRKVTKNTDYVVSRLSIVRENIFDWYGMSVVDNNIVDSRFSVVQGLMFNVSKL